jgi:putative endonuclease
MTITPAKAGAGLNSCVERCDMDHEKAPAVYIMANRYRGSLYVGVTSGLWNRVSDHKNERFDGYTKNRDLKNLVWYEHHHSMEDAIRREKLIKKWRRPWKFRIIEEMNPDWNDLHDSIDTIATLVEAQPRPSPG